MVEQAKVLYSDLIKAGIVAKEVLYEYGVLCAKSEETDKAEDVFKRIIAENPDFVLPYKDLAIIYLSRKFFDRAEEYFKKALKIDPENQFVIFEYANYFYLMSEFENAKKYYLKLLKNDNVPVFMLISTAQNYMAMNMVSKAKQLLLRALEIEPQNIKTLFHLGQIYFFEKNFDNAKQLLEDAYALAPNTEIAHLLAQIYIEKEQYSDAYILLNLVKLSLPDNFTVQLGLAKCMFKKGDYKTAKQHLNNILGKFPEHEDAQNMMKEIEEIEAK